jgi:hypothetical protein
MARRNDDEHAPRRRSHAKTPEERESLLISKSLNLIERQIEDGSVSSTVLSIYAKAGTERDRLEKERLRNENEVLKKKVESMAAAVDVKNLMEDALSAFKGYSGQPRLDLDDDDGYYD